MDIKIKFEPSTYNGWKLEHFQHTEKPFRACKNADFIDAETLPELCEIIKKADNELLLFDPPIKVMWKSNYSNSWIPAEFYAMRDGRVFYRDEQGQAFSEFIRNFTSPHIADGFRLINSQYAALQKKVDAAIKANQATYKKAESLKRQFAKVSSDLFESAKVISGKD